MALRSSDDPKIDRLAQVELFKGADMSALQHLATVVDEVTVAAGTNLILQGHHHNEAYVITRGSVDVVIDGTAVAQLSTGQMIGELGLFSVEPASATVVALEESDLIVIPYNRFDAVLDDNPAMAKRIARQLAARLRRMDSHVV